MIFLHIGCKNCRFEGLVNIDKEDMDIRKTWLYGAESVDGIVSMQVFQCLTWKELMFTFRETYRVLKKVGVMRMGVNLVETNYPLTRVLYGDNINLFSFDLLKNILVDRIGYSSIKLCKFRETVIPEFVQVDSRHKRGSSYLEVYK